MLKVLMAVCVCLGTVKAEDADQKWDRLVVTFPQFNEMPTNEAQAKNAGWIKDAGCNENNVFVGNRYFKDEKSTRLIFGNDGIIAGIQATLTPTSTYPTFSGSSPWIKVNDNEAIATVYFRNPHTICTNSGGNSDKAANTFGHELYLQTKSWLANGGQKAIRIPKNGNQLDQQNSPWVEGKCFPRMGMHYWYNISADMKCEDIFPIFLLYSFKTNKLKSFGWSVPVQVPGATWERPPPHAFGFFFQQEDNPTCLANKDISTQHVYLSDPEELQCE